MLTAEMIRTAKKKLEKASIKGQIYLRIHPKQLKRARELKRQGIIELVEIGPNFLRISEGVYAR